MKRLPSALLLFAIFSLILTACIPPADAPAAAII